MFRDGEIKLLFLADGMILFDWQRFVVVVSTRFGSAFDQIGSSSQWREPADNDARNNDVVLAAESQKSGG